MWGGVIPAGTGPELPEGTGNEAQEGLSDSTKRGPCRGALTGGDTVTTEAEAVRLDGMSEKLPVKEAKERPACGWGERRRRVRFARSDSDGGSLGPR